MNYSRDKNRKILSNSQGCVSYITLTTFNIILFVLFKAVCSQLTE